MTVRPISDAAGATIEWLRAALAQGGLDIAEGDLTRVRSEPLGGDRGNLGSIARLRLDFQSTDTPCPRSLILKFASPGASPLIRSWRFGRRESLYYRTFGGRGPMRTPRCYHASFDDRSGEFSILLEDLGAAATADQEVGASRARAELAVDQLAQLHAHFWNDPSLETEGSWLSLPNANREAFEFFVKRAWQNCAKRYPELPTSSPDALNVLERVYGACLDRLSTAPLTLLHGDFRLDNMLFESVDWATSFAALDWQLVGRGRGPWDLAHFIVGSMTTEDRIAVGPDLVRRYCAIIVKETNGEYSLQECLDDFNAGLLGSFTLAAVLVDSQWKSHGAPSPTMETWLRRAAIGTGEVLEVFERHSR